MWLPGSKRVCYLPQYPHSPYRLRLVPTRDKTWRTCETSAAYTKSSAASFSCMDKATETLGATGVILQSDDFNCWKMCVCTYVGVGGCTGCFTT